MTSAAFRLSSGPLPQGKLALTDAPKRIDEEHRPTSLDELVGQPYAVRKAESFLARGSSEVFLLHGPTGTGKTSFARILCDLVGCDNAFDPDNSYSIHNMKGGSITAEKAIDMFRDLEFAPMPCSKRGWKAVIVNEAIDVMSGKALNTMLEGLENLPPRRLVVFTTNNPDSLPRSFRDRCVELNMTARTDVNGPDAQRRVDEVWAREGMTGDAPRWDALAIVEHDGTFSYRQILRALDPIISDVRAGLTPILPSVKPIIAPTPEPAKRGRKPRAQTPTPQAIPPVVAPIVAPTVPCGPSPEDRLAALLSRLQLPCPTGRRAVHVSEFFLDTEHTKPDGSRHYQFSHRSGSILWLSVDSDNLTCPKGALFA